MLRKLAKGIAFFFILLVLGVLATGLYEYNLFPHKKYTNKDFGISVYQSDHDEDQDGIDDQTDILQSVRAYLATKPKYESKYYEGGYPDDGYGVCTDVVGNGLVGAGYDIRSLVDADIRNNLSVYGLDHADDNIDFRRVPNLNTYFSRKAIPLTCDPYEISEWQGGDIVVWNHHVGVISDCRNAEGIPYVLHHANPAQRSYEQDVLTSHGTIIGHYRIS